jgi:hypothetical protein
MIKNNINNYIYSINKMLSSKMSWCNIIILNHDCPFFFKLIISYIIRCLFLFLPDFKQKKLRTEPIFDIIKSQN